MPAPSQRHAPPRIAAAPARQCGFAV